MMKMMVVVMMLMFYPMFHLSLCSVPMDRASRWTWQGEEEDEDDDDGDGDDDDGGGGGDVSHLVSFLPVLSTSG